MTHPELDRVVIADGPDLRTDTAYQILEDGRIRELRLRVARGVIRDVEQRREPREGKEIA